MNKPLSADDIAAMESQLRDCVAEDRKHWQINDVKCDAIHTAKSYEEFADRVAAAHLRPLEKSDFKNKAKRSWNQYAAKEKEDQE
ncbi:coiled-coil domain-containing protein 103 [Ostrinia furnacalis]|uniref:coiled-coil domain-containing protein 103 n=1 Tax=Ostrinia furnacalis TaxID=93504 RepID=UPI001039C192|nr:coiled-coil domain-containing protein 103 [Ostrinia furnacalis]